MVRMKVTWEPTLALMVTNLKLTLLLRQNGCKTKFTITCLQYERIFKSNVKYWQTKEKEKFFWDGYHEIMRCYFLTRINSVTKMLLVLHC